MSTPAKPNSDAVRAILSGYVNPVLAKGVLIAALQRAGSSDATLDREGLTETLMQELRWGVDLFVEDEARRRECVARLSKLVLPNTAAAAGAAQSTALRTGEPVHAAPAMGARTGSAPAPARAPDAVPIRPMDVPIVDENGIVDARTRARTLAASIGFSMTDQYKLATAVSEVSRNIFRYAGRGRVSFGPTTVRPGMFIVARDEGPGIPNIEHVLSESYVSKTGLGRGLQGCRRIMDEFHIDSSPGRGTTVTLTKYLVC